MIVSFDIKDPEDLELLLALTNRLGIERINKVAVKEKVIYKTNPKSGHEIKEFDEINEEIDSIFGIDNSNISF